MNEFSASRRVEQLNPYDVHEMMDDGPEKVVVIDVREPWEYFGDTGHIKGSVHIPMGDIPDWLGKLKEHDGKSIAVICNSGNRSYSVCQYLQENGFSNVFNIRGGIIQWHLSGLEVEYEE